jgi:hypothetical protein
MPIGRPKKPLNLTNEELVKLQQWARRPKTAQRLALRSRIVLRCAEGLSNQSRATIVRLENSQPADEPFRETFLAARLVARYRALGADNVGRCGSWHPSSSKKGAHIARYPENLIFEKK